MSHFYQSATSHDSNLVKIEQTVDSMCHHNHGAARECLPYDPLHFSICFWDQTTHNISSATTNTDGIKWKPITDKHTCLMARPRSRFCSSLAEPGPDRIAASGPVIECCHLGLNPESLRPCYRGLPQQSPKYRQIAVHQLFACPKLRSVDRHSA